MSKKTWPPAPSSGRWVQAARLSKNDQELVAHFIDEIHRYMAEEDFQRDFFESLVDQFEAKEWLSEKQIEALRRMYERVTTS